MFPQFTYEWKKCNNKKIHPGAARKVHPFFLKKNGLPGNQKKTGEFKMQVSLKQPFPM